MINADDRAYKNEDKIEIIPIRDSEQKSNVKKTTLDTSNRHNKSN